MTGPRSLLQHGVRVAADSDFATDTRSRLTPVDVVFFGAAVVLLGFLAKPWYSVLNDHADGMGTGAAYIFKAIFPALALTILGVIYLTAASGGATK